MSLCRITKIHPLARIPSQQTPSSAGYDLVSTETLVIPARSRVAVHTGIKVALPPNTHLEIRPRSGLALKHGITVLNTPGTIDADYRGEILVILFNTSDEDYTVNAGDRIAQAILMQHLSIQWQETDTLEDTTRGSGGFGSTDIQ